VIVAVLSDVHGNREALEAVLEVIDRGCVQALWFLGDLVGYNPDPDFCAEEILRRAAYVVRGNHDKAVAGLLSTEWFNPVAKQAVQWTRRTACAATLENLARLPAGPARPAAGYVLCHGTPMDEDRYMTEQGAVAESFEWIQADGAARVCFHGHTHRPFAWRRSGPRGRPEPLPPGGGILLEPGCACLINPGSVGQPRDGNPQASFGILDTDSSTYRTLRVPYSVRETQRKIRAAGLPRELALRLAEGA
jgi:predicted phosphodiesterase